MNTREIVLSAASLVIMVTAPFVTIHTMPHWKGPEWLEFIVFVATVADVGIPFAYLFWLFDEGPQDDNWNNRRDGWLAYQKLCARPGNSPVVTRDPGDETK